MTEERLGDTVGGGGTTGWAVQFPAWGTTQSAWLPLSGLPLRLRKIKIRNAPNVFLYLFFPLFLIMEVQLKYLVSIFLFVIKSYDNVKRIVYLDKVIFAFMIQGFLCDHHVLNLNKMQFEVLFNL